MSLVDGLLPAVEEVVVCWFGFCIVINCKGRDHITEICTRALAFCKPLHASKHAFISG